MTLFYGTFKNSGRSEKKIALHVLGIIPEIVLCGTRKKYINDLYESPLDKNLSVIINLVSAEIDFLILVSFFVISGRTLFKRKSNCSADNLNMS